MSYEAKLQNRAKFLIKTQGKKLYLKYVWNWCRSSTWDIAKNTQWGKNSPSINDIRKTGPPHAEK